MIRGKFTHHEITGLEQASYLNQLDSFLKSLQDNLPSASNTYVSEAVARLAEKDKWDSTRLPREENAYVSLAEMVGAVKNEYAWLGWNNSSEHPENNSGYFDRITINAETGLPWGHDFIALNSIMQEAKQRLADLPAAAKMYDKLESIILGDSVPQEEVAAQVKEIHATMMRRNYLKRIQSRQAPDSTGMNFGKLTATKTIELGAETLWHIQATDYSLSTGMFQLYVLDVWQDNLGQPQIVLSGNGIAKISPVLRQTMTLSDLNSAWYALQSIDQAFPSLHPVHMSMMALGPFENKYQTLKRQGAIELDIAKKLLQNDQEAAILRASRKYSYSPNHNEVNGELRQKIYPENWEDAIIVTNSRHSAEVAGSLQGEAIRIFGA